MNEESVGQLEGQTGEVADGGQSAEQTATQQTTEQATGPDWEHEGNPYRAKYTGLQGNFKQVHQQNQQLSQQTRELQQELALVRAQMEGRSPEEIAQIRQGFQQQSQVEQLLGMMAQEVEQAQQIKQVAAPVAKQMVLNAIAKQYGVDAAELADAETPQQAEFYARKMATKQRTQNLQQRKDAGVDVAEHAGGGGTNWDKMSPSEKIAYGVRLAKQGK